MPRPGAGDSSEYRIFETDEFQRKAEKLPAQAADAIRSKLAEYVYPQLKQQPFFGPNIRKLKDYVPDTWRYRIGRYRVFDVVDQAERIVYMISVDLRKDAYKRK